jgi:hypothetical protein
LANKGKRQSGNEKRSQEDWVEANRHNVTKERIDESEEKLKGRLIEVRVLSFLSKFIRHFSFVG